MSMIDQFAERIVTGEAQGVQTSTRVFATVVQVAPGMLMPLAALSVDEAHGTVELVGVEEGCRGRGLARQLLELARSSTGLALDRASQEISPAGRRWCEANAIDLPSRVVDLDPRAAEACRARLFMALNYAEIIPAG